MCLCVNLDLPKIPRELFAEFLAPYFETKRTFMKFFYTASSIKLPVVSNIERSANKHKF